VPYGLTVRYRMEMPQARLSARDWAEAALGAIGERGVAALAVEPLAAALGTTKGSFYWHYSNRDALLTAALDLWEEAHTEAVIRLVDTAGGARDRLLVLFASVSAADDSRGASIEANLLAAADHPLVAPAMTRVSGRRIGYLEGLFRELGCDAEEAGRRALLAYSAYIGSVQLALRFPGVLPARRSDMDAYLASVVTLLTA
jgi:AcrR family transcriptional regulator